MSATQTEAPASAGRRFPDGFFARKGASSTAGWSFHVRGTLNALLRRR
jgi:hypothetical protein